MTGFEADSEGSDNEAVPKAATPPAKAANLFTFSGGNSTSSATVDKLPILIARSPPKPHPMRAEFVSVSQMDTEAVSLADCNGNASSFQTTVTASVSVHGSGAPVSPVAASTAASPSAQKTQKGAIKRTRQPDASKFNRSNRKSKNCATFYFKHSDTDGDTKGWSTQASEVDRTKFILFRFR